MRVAVPIAVALVALASAGATAQVAAADLRQGEYLSEGGWGTLKLAAAAGGEQPFTLFAMGANAHMCDLEGRIVGGKATLESGGAQSACVITFVSKPGLIEVAATDACRDYCGARAWFEGRYLVPAPGCDGDARDATRKRFKRLYDAKRFAPAHALLSPLPERCAKTLHWLERAEILNDIAIAQYRMGDRAGCLRTLAPLTKDADASDAEVEVDGWLAEREAYQPILEAARFNLRLCRKPSR